MGETKETARASSLRDSAELPAGRELDALIAVLVMGWRKHRVAPYPPSESQADKVWRPPYSDHAYCLPDYSTDIAAAWKVVEKLVKSGCKVRVEERVSGSYCDVTGPDSGMDSARENSTPLAICRAALRAVGTSGEVPADSALSPPPPGSPRTET